MFIVEIIMIFNYTKNKGKNKRSPPLPERLRRGKQGSWSKDTRALDR